MNTKKPNNFAHNILEDCHKHDKAFCVDTLGNTLNFKDLHRLVQQCAAALQVNYGVTQRNRVGIFLDDTVNWPVVFLSIIYIGANPLLLFRNFGKKETMDLCRKADCDTVICQQNDEFVDLNAITVDDLMATNTAKPPVCYDWHDDEPCWWALSSGSTYQSKLIYHKHSSFINLYKASNNLVGVTHLDKIMMTGKMSFPWGLSYMIWSLFHKATFFVIHSAPAPSIVFKILGENQISKFMVTPFLLNKMCDTDAKNIPVHTKIYVSGEPLTKTLRSKVDHRFGKRVFDAYGLSEAFACVAIQDDDVEFDNIGNVGEGITFKIIDKKGNTCEPGTPGELWISSPVQALGYWKSHDLTKKIFVGDWIRTGDLVVERAHRKLVFMGRINAFKKIKGMFVNPYHVEEIISAQEGVSECVVKCLQHEGINNLYAQIVPEQEGFDVKALRQTLSTKLTQIQMPKQISVVKSIEKTVNLKKKRIGHE